MISPASPSPMPTTVKNEPRFPRGPKFDLASHGAMNVKVRSQVMEILNIDLAKETFTAVFVIHFLWTDPALRDFESVVQYLEDGSQKEKKGRVVACLGYDGHKDFVIQCDGKTPDHIEATNVVHIKQPDWDSGKFFVPEWTMLNCMGKAETLVHQRQLEFCSSAGGHVSDKWKFMATFCERLELRDMPFDRQVLRMKFAGEVEMHRMQFSPLANAAGALKGGHKDFPDAVPVEWAVDEKYKATLMVTNPEFAISPRPRFDVVVHLQRKPGFYLWNVIFVLFFIVLASATAFYIDPQNVSDRASVLLTLLLTTVGYKFVMAQWMPVKPYLTFLDKYILICFMIQFIVIAESLVVVQLFCTRVQDDDANWRDGNYTGFYRHRSPPSHECASRLADFEEYFAIALYAAWIGWHVVLLLHPRLAVSLTKFDSVLCYVGSQFGKLCSACFPDMADKPNTARFLRFISRTPYKTWDNVYSENKIKIGDYLQPTGGHPYGQVRYDDLLKKAGKVSSPQHSSKDEEEMPALPGKESQHGRASARSSSRKTRRRDVAGDKASDQKPMLLGQEDQFAS